MFNYKYHCGMTHWIYSNEKNGFIVKAKQEIKRGEEVKKIYLIIFNIDLCILWK